MTMKIMINLLLDASFIVLNEIPFWSNFHFQKERDERVSEKELKEIEAHTDRNLSSFLIFS